MMGARRGTVITTTGSGEHQHKVHKVQGTVVVEGGSAGDSTSCFSAGRVEAKDEEASVEKLFAAVKSGASRVHVESILKKLSASGAEPRAACAATDEGGHALTHWAAKRGDAILLEKLLERGAPADAPSRDEVGMRPLHWACTENRIACMRLLVAYGADVNARDLQGCTPLIIASQWGQADAVAYLVKIGADVRILDKNDDSALHWASYKGNLEIVGLLHHLGLAIDDADAYGQTPLHLAALCGNLSIAEYLLIDAPPADRATPRQMLDARDKKRKTPLDLAREKRRGAVARFLESQRPLCERGFLAFAREKMTLKACVYWFLGGSNPEAMKWPWAVMVFNKLVAQFFYFAYFLRFYAPVGGAVDAKGVSSDSFVDVPAVVHAINLNTQIVAWIAFVLAWRVDPGTIDGRMFDGALRRAYDAYFDRLVDGRQPPKVPSVKKLRGAPPPADHPTLCHSCHIQRPLRAKHCRVRRKCVMAFDHYCPYVGNAVGLYNYRYFFLYCLSFTLAALEWQYVAIAYQIRHGKDWALVATQVWFVPFILFGVAMVVYHAQLVGSNLTTNEHMNFHRYDYFRDPETLAFKNPYDHGFLANFIDRFFPTPLHNHPLILQVTAYLDDDDDGGPSTMMSKSLNNV
ncbi:hypothetical protein CTAYLR_000424 [Chrysophaeum taylorii]|uniref:Palmitoyltransferase n=1 Tax=Chrysophaeum taylorii TaxID=2483200 RepID=A0AAD7UG32_9STRA|nr:hypothetical protein CTAYLR_000424 [Chrysophaeum taylorii]